jgi:type IV pilus assembly protein PilV
MNQKERRLYANRVLRERSGFTIIEVLIGIVILAVGLLAIAALQVSAMRTNSFAGDLSEANAYAQAKMEALIALPYDHSDLDDAEEAVDTVTSFTEPSPPPGYSISWTVDVDNPIPDTKQIRVTVSWFERGQSKTTVLTTYKSIY